MDDCRHPVSSSRSCNFRASSDGGGGGGGRIDRKRSLISSELELCGDSSGASFWDVRSSSSSLSGSSAALTVLLPPLRPSPSLECSGSPAALQMPTAPSCALHVMCLRAQPVMM